MEANEASVLEFLVLICHPARKPARKRSGAPQPTPTPSAIITARGKSVEQAQIGVVAAVDSAEELAAVLAMSVTTVRVGAKIVSTDGVGCATVVEETDILDVM